MIDFTEMNRMILYTEKVSRDIQAAEGQTEQIESNRWKPAARKKKINISDLKETYACLLADLEGLRSELSVMIDSLPDKDQRIILTLRYLKGYQPDVIAAGTHISVRNVFYIMKRAKNTLKELFPDRISYVK